MSSDQLTLKNESETLEYLELCGVIQREGELWGAGPTIINLVKNLKKLKDIKTHWEKQPSIYDENDHYAWCEDMEEIVNG